MLFVYRRVLSVSLHRSRDFNWNFQLFAGNLVPLDGI